MADALDKLRSGVDKARTKLASQRLGGREYIVTIQYWQPGNDMVGTGGTWSTPPVTLSPTPQVTFKDVFRMTDGGLMKIGDVQVKGISRANYQESDLRGAAGAVPALWSIEGRPYQVVEIQAKPLEYSVVLASRGE